MGGTSSEHDISLKTGSVVVKSLDREKYNVIPVTISQEGTWLLPSSGANKKPIALKSGEAIESLRFKLKADVVFLALHGKDGEDGTIQGLLEFAGIPYTGSGVLASALAMDKEKSSELLQFHDLSVPDFVCFWKEEFEDDPARVLDVIEKQIGIPSIIKPNNGGSSVGISIIRSAKELAAALTNAFRYDDRVMVQKLIVGDEVTCAVLDDGSRKPFPLPPTHIIPKHATFFDYDAKYTPGASEEITPPKLSEDVIQNIQKIAVKVHAVLGCSGMSRTDMIVQKQSKSQKSKGKSKKTQSGQKIYVLETNTIPGMTETSLLPKAAEAVGISFPQLLDRIIDAAQRKNKRIT